MQTSGRGRAGPSPAMANETQGILIEAVKMQNILHSRRRVQISRTDDGLSKCKMFCFVRPCLLAVESMAGMFLFPNASLTRIDGVCCPPSRR